MNNNQRDEGTDFNLKDIVQARFQNPKYVYDGKRMRSLSTRKSLDYTTGLLDKILFDKKPPLVKRTIFDIKAPDFYKNRIEDAMTTEFAHICLNKIKSPVNVIKWTPDGRRLVSGSATGEFTMWGCFNFNFETILQAHESPIRALCWAPTGSFLVSADTLGIIKYWHPSMNNIQLIQGHKESVRDLSFSPTDTKFCSASDDGKIKIWDSVEAKEENVLSGHGWDVKAAKWHGRYSLIASGGKDNLIKLWDPRTASELKTLHFHKNSLLSLCWSLDGNYLISSAKDKIIKMLDIRTMKDIMTYKSHKKEQTTIEIHPSIKNYFVTAGLEGEIFHWEFFNPEPLTYIKKAHESAVWSLNFHPIGHLLASGSMDQSIRFWIRERKERIQEPQTNPIPARIPGLIYDDDA